MSHASCPPCSSCYLVCQLPRLPTCRRSYYHPSSSEAGSKSTLSAICGDVRVPPRQHQAPSTGGSPGQPKPIGVILPCLMQHDVSSILMWITCFCTYLTILVEAHPELVKSCLAYLEARHNGGDRWLLYDAKFCQNMAEDELADWAKLDTSLHTATVGAQSTGSGSNAHTAPPVTTHRMPVLSSHSPGPLGPYPPVSLSLPRTRHDAEGRR